SGVNSCRFLFQAEDGIRASSVTGVQTCALPISTEIDWPAHLYADLDGRPDLLQTLVRPGQACRSGRVCYVVVQVGRLYFLNEERSEERRVGKECSERWARADGTKTQGHRDSARA